MRIKTVTSPNVECSAPGHSSYVATSGDGHSQAATGCFADVFDRFLIHLVDFLPILYTILLILPCFHRVEV